MSVKRTYFRHTTKTARSDNRQPFAWHSGANAH